MTTWWLQAPNGTSIGIGPTAISLGRASTCNVVLDSEQASRLHAMIALVSGAPVLVPLGRAGTHIDGEPVDKPTPLRSGQRVELPGATLELVGWDDPAPDWTVHHQGLTLRVAGTMTVGGGRRDGLRIPQLAEGAVLLTAVGDGLVIEVRTTASLDGVPLEPGELVHARADQILLVQGHRLRLASQVPTDAPTQLTAALLLPLRAVFTFEPTGGRLELTVGADSTEVQLSELRARLIASLLSPPKGLAPGDAVPDEQLVPMIWPGEARGRLDINQLVHRTRKDFLAVGLDGLDLIQRGGGGTAFMLAPGAIVEVR